MRDSYDEMPSAEALVAMRAVSPAAHVAAVCTPVLMLLGAKDRRVPPSNGLSYARALKQRGVPVRTIIFPEDEHPLSKPRTELECYVSLLAWLEQWGVK
jgi:acylaminoacyl-peptidase